MISGMHGGWKFVRRASLLCLAAAAALPVRAEIAVDGRIDESEWETAIRCEDWRRTTPFTRDQPRYRNDVRILSTERGLAAAFILDQPPQERRMKPRTPRDAEAFVGDTVALVVDFDATAQVGYEFAVALGGGVRDGLVTNQNKFDRDWDGEWRHAVAETEDSWSVEIFIPWSTVSMRGGGGDTRLVGVYASRYLFGRDERYACPAIAPEAAVFLSDFERLRIREFEAQSYLTVIPYATAVRDLIADDSRFKAGADITWKASPSFWLAATLNPDFGHVESDELVVDFSAIETVFTDKRPFFTENQGFFDLRTPANGQLIYTRRIGAAPDDLSSGSSDIDAAFKLRGDVGALGYGVFVAQEEDYAQEIGRRFAAARLVLPLERVRAGYLSTWTDRPLLDRDAWINAVDVEITPNDWWRVAGQLIRSDIGSSGAGARTFAGEPPRRSDVHADGYQAWVQADLNRSGAVTHTFKLLHVDDRFDLNDLGYMERNALDQVEWDVNRRTASAVEGRINGETQRLYAFYRENADGQRLQSRVQLSRDVQYRSSWRAYEELRYVTSGVDDLLSRGHGPVQLDGRIGAYADVTTPRYGDWQFTLGGYVFNQGLEDYSGRLEFLVHWQPSDALTLRVDVLPQHSRDWLLWENGNLFGSYEADSLDFDFRIDWVPSPRHELRLKWQWIGIDADPRQAYRTDASGRLIAVDEPIAPFTVSNLGLQLRYKYEFAPQSDLYLVYGRGGFDLLTDDERDLGRLFHDMSDVRDADQFLVKVSYRL